MAKSFILVSGKDRLNKGTNKSYLSHNSISLKDIAETANILSMDRNTVIDEINISPATKLINFN